MWQPTSFSTGSLGYRHDFVNSLLGSYYDVDAVFIGWGQHFWRLNVLARLEYQNQRFQGVTAATAVVPTDRTDNLLLFNTRIELPIRPWLTPAIGYDLAYNNSNASLQLGPAGVVPVDYTKHQVWARLTILY